ncbi:MAG: dihydroxyacetone kinase subunit DhaL [Chloroflexota bacterium]|nr:dihydroxyacetone kinase subunit DhaL [Chloroflexota bacterium]
MSIRIGDDNRAADRTGLTGRHPSEDPASRPAGVAAPFLVTAVDLLAFAARAERALVRHRVCLDRLDARLGDGDHGENMSVGFGDAARSIGPEDDEGDIGDLLRRMGHTLVAGVGGAGGSLYGTALIEAGIAVLGRRTLDARGMALALDAAAEGLARRGRCRLGDKTIYDALRPAADAFTKAVDEGLDSGEALTRAAAVARAGMLATRPLIARRGLALRLGERSRGHQDPGATSCFLIMRSMLPPAGRAR